MAMALVAIGFKPDHVYLKMGMAEFNLHFITAMKMQKRVLQMQSATFLGSVGCFFLKKGEKTIIEKLGQEIKQLDLLLGCKPKKASPAKIFQNLFGISRARPK